MINDYILSSVTTVKIPMAKTKKTAAKAKPTEVIAPGKHTAQEWADLINASLERMTGRQRRPSGQRRPSEGSAMALRCVKCGRRLKASEPVWRARFRNGLGLYGQGAELGAHCEKCRPDDREYFLLGPCDSCGREVNTSEQRCGRHRQWVFCSEACQRRHLSIHYAALARQQRAEARGATRVCADCGEHFEPVRADSLYCSGACRQKAYRKRVTVAKETRINIEQLRSLC